MAGVQDSWVGYVRSPLPEPSGRSDSPALDPPTYESVCNGDGHTEALRLRLDPRTLPYEALLRKFCSDPRISDHPNGGRGSAVQYRTAIWAQTPRQHAIAQRVVAASGKDIPIELGVAWHEAEDWHQHFLTDFKDFPDDDIEYAPM